MPDEPVVTLEPPMSTRGSYLEIKHHVLGKIRAGAWPPGTLIPKERELAEAFGCARMTVHRALRELADEGVVERRRRSGTRVALQTTRSAMLEIPRVDQEIERQGAIYRYRRIARRIVVRTAPSPDTSASPRREKRFASIACTSLPTSRSSSRSDGSTWMRCPMRARSHSATGLPTSGCSSECRGSRWST